MLYVILSFFLSAIFQKSYCYFVIVIALYAVVFTLLHIYA